MEEKELVLILRFVFEIIINFFLFLILFQIYFCEQKNRILFPRIKILLNAILFLHYSR